MTAMSETRDLTPAFHMDRRQFIKTTGAVGAALTLGRSVLTSAAVETVNYGNPDPPETEPGVRIVRSVCLMCHSACGIQGKVVDGTLVKVDGNPYHPNAALPHERLPYTTPPEQADLVRGHNCVKSQAAVQTVYDPYRLRNPLKRVGPRGSGQWQEISWKQALDEIADKLRPYYQPGVPIDPAFPEFGDLPNKVLFSAGRIEHGQKEFTDRIWKNGFGTVNYRHDHTSICEVSHHTGGDLMTDFKAHHFKPDILNADYLIWFGTRPLEAGFPMQTLTGMITDFLARGGRMVTVDPVLSNTAARSHRWIPIKPGTDAAFALGMARWMIDNDRFDRNFLTNTKPNVNGEKSYSDATFLVDESTGTFLRDPSGEPLVWNGGQPWPASLAPGSKGELDPGVVSVNGTTARTVWSRLVERVREKTLDEYAAICGIDVRLIEETAREFAAAGKKGVANPYRGPVKHTNGAYNLFAIHLLNILNGNFDWKGGNSKGGSHFGEMGGKAPGQVNLKTVVGGLTPSGVPISRHGKHYETDAPNLFARDGYPARRPWFPFNKRWCYQEILPSIKDGYPYPVEAVILYWNDLLYSTPAARAEGERILADENKIKLLVAFDILIGETSKWADYILPDTTWLERFSTPHVSPAILTKTSGFRQPLVGEFIEETIDGKTRRFYVSPLSQGNVARDFWLGTDEATGPQLMEDIMIALGGRLGLPGIGAGAFDLTGAAPGYDWRSGLYSAWDWYLNILNNLSIHSGVPVEEILAKGGVFEPTSGDPSDPAVAYDGDYLRHRFENLIHIYIEPLATTRDSMTGQFYDPLPKYEPIRDVLDRPVTASPEFDLHVVTYRYAYHAQARTIANPWLQGLRPENAIEMNAADGEARGLRTGDLVRVESPTGAVAIGRVRLTEGIRPGVIGVPHSFGHWEMGSNGSNTIDGQPVAHDPARGRGIAINPLLMTDPYLGDVCLQDKIGGSASFYDTRVRVVPAGGTALAGAAAGAAGSRRPEPLRGRTAPPDIRRNLREKRMHGRR
ncbi:MAG: twin-arginine translocation signal domain-containing protein [Acidobacteria bacterium]|nr:MAG: twin-arginine translocation signal domain-containing protein [Acidobacteriota bacterium]